VGNRREVGEDLGMQGKQEVFVEFPERRSGLVESFPGMVVPSNIDDSLCQKIVGIHGVEPTR
jgi:hypothetical protein